MISRHPGASNSEIARRVFVTRQSMNTLLRELQDRGLVQRATHAHTGRAIPTTLTGQGQRLQADAAQRIDKINQTLSDALDPDQQTALTHALTQCIEALDTMPSQPSA